MITGVIDTDRLVAFKLDDGDLFNLALAFKCLVCYDEIFWERRLIHKYGEKVDGRKMKTYKSKYRSWKEYYLSLTYYNEKYYQTKALQRCIKQGLTDLAYYFIDSGADKNKGLQAATRAGNMELANYFHNKGDSDPNFGLLGAARGGNLKLVKSIMLIDDILGNKSLKIDHKVLEMAGRSGNTRLFNFVIENIKWYNERMIKWGIWGAIRGGHRDLICRIKKVYKYDELSSKSSMYNAARRGDKDLVGSIVKNIKSFEEKEKYGIFVMGLAGACRKGDRELVDFFIRKITKHISLSNQNAKKNHWAIGLENSAKGGHEDLVNFFIERVSYFGKAIDLTEHKKIKEILKEKQSKIWKTPVINFIIEKL